MSGEAQGIVSDAGDAVQRKINQASDTQGQIVEYIRQARSQQR
jgi:hypothetical protein